MFRAWLMLTILFSVGFPLCAQERANVLHVSLLQLIVTPEKYDGQLIQVRGYLDMGREGDLLYLHQVDSENVLLENALWIRRTEQMGIDKQKLDLRYVTVTGTFMVGFKEQLGNPNNGIRDVIAIEPWSDPANPVKHRITTIPGVSSDEPHLRIRHER